MRIPRGTLPKPTHGNGLTPTASLAPQACRACGAELVVVGDEITCPKGCEACV